MKIRKACVIFFYWILLNGLDSFNGVFCGSTVVVDSPFGKIEGVRKTDEVTGESYVSFQGIPYAKPPVGPLRFHKPEPHPTLDGVFDATKDEWIICPHNNDKKLPRAPPDTEDCLVLNILVKNTDASGEDLRKVLVYIHGGGFFEGTSYFQPAKSFVISQDVIVVTINYRLGVLGFLSTEDEASPGNYGLWDQTLALKWVKDNIRAFGGDPDDVTIAGESAGGASVGFQILTPHAKGLFSKAYQQSGTATSVFALTRDARQQALKVAKGAGCWSQDVDYKLRVEESTAIIQCLRNVPSSVLTSFNVFSNLMTIFVPRVDGDFITDTPSNLLKNDAYLESIDYFDRIHLVGINNMESLIFHRLADESKKYILSDSETSREERQLEFDETIKAMRKFNTRVRLEMTQEPSDPIIKAVEDFYDRRFANNVSGVMELVSDVFFLVPSLDFLMAAARRKSCSSYLFFFDYFPQFMKGSYRGTPHALDLIYWFDISVDTLEESVPMGAEGEMWEEDMELKRKFSSVIGDFVKYGNPGKSLTLNQGPSATWSKYDVISSPYLNFNLNPWVGGFLEKDRQDFWFKTMPQLLKEDRQKNTHTEL